MKSRGGGLVVVLLGETREGVRNFGVVVMAERER